MRVKTGQKYGCTACGRQVEFENTLCGLCNEQELIEHYGSLDKFEDAMDDFEEDRRQRIAERNEY